jgi:hypothetical protein
VSRRAPRLTNMAFTQSEFRKALGVFPTGVAVVTARAPDGLLQGTTVSSFNSVALEPPLVLFSFARTVLSFAAWQTADVWGISVLGETPDGLSVPRPLAHFECERYVLHGGDDHLIFGAAHQWHQLRHQFCTSARISDSARGRAGWSTESQYAANGGE